MTQEQLGEILGKTKSYIYQLESQRRQNPDPSLVMLFETMEMNPASFHEMKRRVRETSTEYRHTKLADDAPPVLRGDSLEDPHSDDEIEERIIELLGFLRNSRTRNRGDFAFRIKQLVDRLASDRSQVQSQSQSQRQ